MTGYLIGLTSILMPRCHSELEHQQHVTSVHVSHFHHTTDTNPELAHIGHEKHNDKTNLINILQHLFDDLDNPKEKCEFGFFANTGKSPVNVSLLATLAVFKQPQYFIPAIENPKAAVEYCAPNFSPPDKEVQQQRGPPTFLV